MTNEEMPAGPPSAVLAARLKQLRAGHGMTVQALAKKCAEAGNPDLTATMIYNIESGRPDANGKRRRHVTVDELLTLAVALDVGPLDLLLPADDDAPYQVTPTIKNTASQVRAAFRGSGPLDPGRRGDARYVFARLAESVPRDELERILRQALDDGGDDGRL